MTVSYEQNMYSEAEQRIFEERARRLAQPPEVPVSGETVGLVVLVLGVERYGVDVRFVQDVEPLDTVTSLPQVPPFWAGLVSLRGHIYPLLDLRDYLGLPAGGSTHKGSGATAAGRVALVAAHGVEAGLLVDDVLEVRMVRKSEIGPSLVDATGMTPASTTGVTSDLLTVLDVEALLIDPRLTVQAA